MRKPPGASTFLAHSTAESKGSVASSAGHSHLPTEPAGSCLWKDHGDEVASVCPPGRSSSPRVALCLGPRQESPERTTSGRLAHR